MTHVSYADALKRKRIGVNVSILQHWYSNFSLPVEGLEINPKLPADYFEGFQISEWISANLWYGPFTGTLASISATHPIPSVPELWHLTFNGSR